MLISKVLWQVHDALRNDVELHFGGAGVDGFSARVQVGGGEVLFRSLCQRAGARVHVRQKGKRKPHEGLVAFGPIQFGQRTTGTHAPAGHHLIDRAFDQALERIDLAADILRVEPDASVRSEPADRPGRVGSAGQ